MSDIPGPEIWTPVLEALETERRFATSIRGASGLEHPVTALGIDEGRKRLIVISSEPNARSAALAQADIQGGLPELRVVVARPVALNPAAFAAAVEEAFGSFEIGLAQLASFQTETGDANNELIEALLMPLIGPFVQAIGPLGFVAAFGQALTQLRLVRGYSSQSVDPESGAVSGDFGVDVSGLSDLDPQADDRDLGICSIPLFAFSAEEMEALSGLDSDIARALLERHDVLQYFFPAADQLALGVIERTPGQRADVLAQITSLPQLGHPLGPMELVSPTTRIASVIDELRGQGFLVEGDLELTAAGETARANVRFRPKEGVVSKLINRISVTIDITTRFFGSG